MGMPRPSLVLLCLVLAACSTAPSEGPATLQTRLESIARRARPAKFGIGVLDLDSREDWYVEGDRPLPLQSAFKAALAAAVLSRVDSKQLRLDDAIVLTAKDLSIDYSPIAQDFLRANVTERSFSFRELVDAAVTTSDNTAADVLLEKIGGPPAVSRFLEEHGISNFRVDRYERDLQSEFHGIPRFDASMSTSEGSDAAVASVPPERRIAAYEAYLADPRDRASPRAAITFLDALAAGRLLGEESTRWLRQTMAETMTGKNRLRAGLDAGTRLEHKTGTSGTVNGRNGATNDYGIATLPSGRRVAIAAFLSDSSLPEAEREALLADVARAVATTLR